MSEVNNKNMYLNLEGLQTYNRLIQKFITDNDSELSTAIGALNAKLGEFEFDSSDDMTVAATLEYIKGAIAELVAKDYELFAKDAELEKKIAEEIGKIVGELGDSDSHMTLVDIADQLKSLGSSVSANTENISKITERVAAVEKSIADLGEIEGGENLGTVVGKVNSNAEAIETLKGEEGVLGSVKNTAKSYAEQAQAAAEATAAADATTKANAAQAAAEATAKEYADKLNGAMDGRVAALEKNDHNHENKTVLDGISAEKVAAWDAAEQNAKAHADGLKTTIDAAYAQADANTLAAAKTYVDGKFDEKGAAAQALVDAKAYVNGIVDDVTGEDGMVTKGLNSRIADLEAINHEKLAADASAAAVAAIVDNADSDFDTLREVAEWIKSDTTGAAALQVKVAEHTESINALESNKVSNDDFTKYQGEMTTALAGKVDNSYKEDVTAALKEKATVVDLNALNVKVETDIANLKTLLGDYSGTLGDVDDRLEALEKFEETHASIEISQIEGLFPSNSKPEA